MRISDLQKVYFVCTGNTCRSPMAQRILQDELQQAGVEGVVVRSRKANLSSNSSYPSSSSYSGSHSGSGFTVVSTGSASGGAKAKHSSKYQSYGNDLKISPEAKDILLKEYGDQAFVDAHTATAITREELEEADIIIAMEPQHLASLKREAGAYSTDKRLKIYTLGQLVGEPDLKVNDPMVGSWKSEKGYKGAGFTSWKPEAGSAPKDDEGDVFSAAEGATSLDELLLKAQADEAGGVVIGFSSPDAGRNGTEPQGPRHRKTDARDIDHKAEAEARDRKWEEERMADYRATFEQLRSLIRKAMQQDLRMETLHERMVSELNDVYQEHLEPKKSSYSPTSASECVGKGDFEAAERALSRENLDRLDVLEKLCRLHGAAAVSYAPLRRGLSGFLRSVEDTIIPRMLRREYITDEWEFDAEAFSQEAGKPLLRLAARLPGHFEKADRDAAFSIAELSIGLLQAGTKLLTETDIRALYGALSGEKPTEKSGDGANEIDITQSG